MVSTLSTLELQTIPPIATPQVYTHLVTLIHRGTGQEESLLVETMSDRFAGVIREICHLRVINGLLGYEVFEVLDLNDPF